MQKLEDAGEIPQPWEQICGTKITTCSGHAVKKGQKIPLKGKARVGKKPLLMQIAGPRRRRPMPEARYCRDCGHILAQAEGSDGRCWNCHRDYEKMLDLQSRAHITAKPKEGE
jgi:hypothetical protein